MNPHFSATLQIYTEKRKGSGIEDDHSGVDRLTTHWALLPASWPAGAAGAQRLMPAGHQRDAALPFQANNALHRRPLLIVRRLRPPALAPAACGSRAQQLVQRRRWQGDILRSSCCCRRRAAAAAAASLLVAPCRHQREQQLRAGGDVWARQGNLLGLGQVALSSLVVRPLSSAASRSAPAATSATTDAAAALAFGLRAA